MRETVANLVTMLQLSWQADRLRSVGALITTALIPVTRPLRAIGLGVLADGVASGSFRRAATGAVAIAGLTAAGRLFDWASMTVRMRLREHTILLLDERVIDLAASAPSIEHYERPDYHDRMELLQEDRGFLVNPFMPIAWTVASVVQVATTVVVLGALHPALILLPIAGVPSLVLTARGQKMREQVRDEQAPRWRLTDHFMRLATEPASAKEVRVFDLAPELERRHREVFAVMDRRQYAIDIRTGVLMAIGWTVFAVSYMAAVGFVAMRAVAGGFTIGDVVLTLSLGAQIASQLSELVGTTSWFSRTAHAVGRYRWLLSYARASTAATTPTDPAPVPEVLKDGIVFDKVTFSYPGTEAKVLEDVTLRLPAGTIVAIVGENGAGKTTLIKLLTRFYEPTAGRVLVDGIDITRFAVEDWRHRMSGAFQDFAKVQFSARQSVGVGKLSDVDDIVAVRAALDRAAASDLPGQLPDGLDTQLGREFGDGVELSIGQWQKIAIGRAMMRPNPLVLVLDEPTASLDAQTEHALFDRFAAAARETAATTGAITVLVSHRFSTVRMADVIVVITEGGVRECGSHSELVAAGGLYAELYEMQARSYR
jgi:ATP-binding cassette subfamily B protein